jgi:dihydroorotate dehydrogenase (NAD+) catalytic subunit
VEEIVAAARAATTKTLYAKLSPAVPDVAAAAAARSARRSGRSDAREHDPRARARRADARAEARLWARRALRSPRSARSRFAAVFAAYRETGLPIVGVGGVETGAHALDLIAAGSSAFALGTVLFADPGSARSCA